MANMKATLVARTRIVCAENAFAELALWRVSSPVAGSAHEFKYRLAYVVDGQCVVRYDNERGKSDHRHIDGVENDYRFVNLAQLLADFKNDVENRK